MQCLIHLARLTRGPAKPVTLVLALGLLLVTLLPGVAYGANVWKDISDAKWQEIYRVSAQDAHRVAQGYSDGTFRPNQPVTRGQFAKMAVDGLGIPAADPATPSFVDVPRSHPFYRQIEGAHKAGIVSGYPDGSFKPDANLIRQQGYSMLGKFLAKIELEATGIIKDGANTYSSLQAWYSGVGSANLTGYSDSTSMDSAHKPAAAYLVHMGVVLGSASGTQWYLSPVAQLNRAPAVAMILRTEAKVLDLAKPSITSLAPTGGPLAGGNSVVITGKGFVGVTAVKFGAVAAISYTVNTGTQITAVAPPSATANTVTVSVTAKGGTSADTAADDYTYAVGPTVTGLNPTAGPTSGGTSVVITGTGFTGATSVLFGDATVPFTVNSSVQITATSPSHAVATVGVRVVTPGGTSPDTAADNYLYADSPSLVSMQPNRGLTGGGNQVTITGTNFIEVKGVTFGGVAASYSVSSNTQIVATSPPHAPGDVTVQVAAGGGQTSLADPDAVFTYVAAPSVSQVEPPAGPVDGGNVVQIVGNNLAAVNLVAFGDSTVAPTTVSDRTVTVTVPALSGVPQDRSVNVVVTTPLGSVTAPGAYLYLLPPTVASIDPTTGPTQGGYAVTITGFHFFHAKAVRFGSVAASIVSISSDGRTMVVLAPSAQAAGAVGVTVETWGGSVTSPGAFMYAGTS